MSSTDTNQASEDKLDTVLKQHREWMRGIRTDRLIGTSHAETKAAIQSIIRTEKLKLLDEVRERVIGEHKPANDDDAKYNFPEHYDRLNARHELSVEQREALTKLEAEL